MTTKLLAPVLPPCKVCGEVSTGFHYGVNTCGGCKGFFGRALVRSDNLRCMGNGACDIVTQGKRKRVCQKCRYEKCLKVGMSKESIKTGRYSYSKKSQDTLELNQYLAETGKAEAGADYVLLQNKSNKVRSGMNEEQNSDAQSAAQNEYDMEVNCVDRDRQSYDAYGNADWLTNSHSKIPRLFEKQTRGDPNDLLARDFHHYGDHNHSSGIYIQQSHDHRQSQFPNYQHQIHTTNENIVASAKVDIPNNNFEKSDFLETNEEVPQSYSRYHLHNESCEPDDKLAFNGMFKNQSESYFLPVNHKQMSREQNLANRDYRALQNSPISKDPGFRNTLDNLKNNMYDVDSINPQKHRVSLFQYPPLVKTLSVYEGPEDQIHLENNSSVVDAEILPLNLSPSNKSTSSDASANSFLPNTPSDTASASTPDRQRSPNVVGQSKTSLSDSPSLLRTFSFHQGTSPPKTVPTANNYFMNNIKEKVFASSFDTSDCSMFFSRLFVREMDQILPIMTEGGAEGTQLCIVPVKRWDSVSFMVQLKRQGVCSTFYLPPANAKTASRADILTLDELMTVAAEKENVQKFRSEFSEDDLMELVEQIVESHNKHVKCDTNTIDPEEFESIVSTCHKTCVSNDHDRVACTMDFDTYQEKYEQTGTDVDGRRTIYNTAVLMLETTIVKAVRFFKGIPGVQRMFSLEDQIGLIKGGMQEYLMLAGFKGRDCTRRVQLDAELNHLQCEHDMGKLFPQYHVDEGFKVSKKLQNLDLNLLEIIVLKAMAISSPDTDYIKDHHTVGQFYWKLVNCLLLLLHRTGRSNLFPAIVDALVELKEYSHCCWKWSLQASVILNHVHLETTPLLRETFFDSTGSSS